ncbi:uncharacterized protein RMCC_5651 [Mycolicibacterium canariasense]|uniref:Uncharacterized protein n=1 Tax=Mycolicibacterium canariasense TaxID=228230 RepID=A0A100WIF9_MYCCR|nr:hypothetical protein [Mycolicibacterium canariasense]MCV7212191.1 hypothetical protein [Mycolicibacterium canariasense]ORU95309.1 hypothetical protein AWB94_32130 [Mycolicibacterium canariasense]GAS98686.1 uncharacterized protein RMCC_5651 [Mycolicibacterium canariasense]
MANSSGRYAAAALAAFTPLTVIGVITAAPGSADCVAGQSEFNGNCVSWTCKRSEVRDAGTGECRSALAAAFSKAQAPAVAGVTAQQWSDAAQVAQQYGQIPSGIGAAKDVFSVANSAIDIPTSVVGGISDAADAVYYVSKALGSVGGSGGTSIAKTSVNAMSRVADAAQAVSSVKVGLPKIGVPRLFQNCLPVKFAFFRPCI